MMYGGHMGGWGILFMGLSWILLLILIGLLARQFFNRSGPSSPVTESPLDILKKRYARGEITKAEFDRMRADLQS